MTVKRPAPRDARKSHTQSHSEQTCFVPSFICKFGFDFEDVPSLHALIPQSNYYVDAVCVYCSWIGGPTFFSFFFCSLLFRSYFS